MQFDGSQNSDNGQQNNDDGQFLHPTETFPMKVEQREEVLLRPTTKIEQAFMLPDINILPSDSSLMIDESYNFDDTYTNPE